MNDQNDFVSIKIPSSAEYIDIVRLTLYGIATRMGYSYEDIEDMKVAVAEACNNAVLHAYGEDKTGMIEIIFDMKEDGLSITVKDEGESFDFENATNRAASLHDKTLDQINVGGLGIYMMQALMDDVQVRSNQGTEVILTKMLTRL